MQAKFPNIENLQTVLGYQFANLELLKEALTHSSARHQRDPKEAHGGRKSYERLEFLGDRVLGLCVAHMLFTAFPNEPEGHLAKRHALLVSKPTLAQIARELNLNRFILVSPTEKEHGGLTKDGLLSDVVESIIAAMYLDGGIADVSQFIKKHWQERLSKIKRPPQDPKTSLQEWSQGVKKTLPRYDLIDHSGPSHQPVFQVRVYVDGYGSADGQGSSKREAEQAAAEGLIRSLKAAGIIRADKL